MHAKVTPVVLAPPDECGQARPRPNPKPGDGLVPEVRSRISLVFLPRSYGPQASKLLGVIA